MYTKVAWSHGQHIQSYGRDILIQSTVLHIPQMGSMLYLALLTRQSVSGMQQQEHQWVSQGGGILVVSGVLHTHQMVTTLSLAQLMRQSVSGMQQQENQWVSH